MTKLIFILFMISSAYADCGMVGSITDRIEDCKFQKISDLFIASKIGTKVILYNKPEDVLIMNQDDNQKCTKPYKKKNNKCKMKNASRFYLVRVN